ncbi:MAG: PfaD family polyunsaturated fatty acid/polyketide biosynthesis protein, partial [Gemmataceae bacterium]|nr:PfaD family polyunsaturated fatty acid/polyketide biosynthesis protein [Gemmataceae bacterium]
DGASFGAGSLGQASHDGASFGAGSLGQASRGGSHPVVALLPPCPPETLGDPDFRREHGLRYAYVAGAMANGIGSCEIVEEMCRAGMLGFFGAAGLSPDRVAAAIDRLQARLGDRPFGFNLIHSPNEPRLEAEIVELYLRRGVRLVEASAYLDLTLPVVKYRVAGIHRGPDGQPIAPNRIIAKVSRVEVASKFMAPPPERFLRVLREQGFLDDEQVRLASRLPMAQDVTGEADSGGHTDNRPAITLIPTLLALRDRLQRQYSFAQPIRVGAAGGIATPQAAAGAFTLGASYILTGSINQACVESGSSDLVREMLAEAEQADVTMAPAADMFEMGVKVQVLKRGTMFPMRAARLYELYRAYPSLDAIPPAEKVQLEKNIFRQSLEETWAQTCDFFRRRDPSQIAKAEADPKHKMALVFRWYLGQSSRWANQGLAERKMDFQIWCGPAMGAFNEWTKGTFFERPENRRVAVVAMNLLYGAGWTLRARALQQQGVRVPDDWLAARPMEPAELKRRLDGEVADQ